MLRAAELSFAYGENAVLHGVSFEIPRGGLVGLLGPNGSGKTTLLRLIAGVLSPTTGSVLLDGRDLKTLARRDLARRIAVVPQDTRLTFDFRVLELALMGRYPYLGALEIEGPADVDAARRALDATGTLHLEGRRFETLSGGERQRVVIASALAQFEDALAGDRNSGPREPDGRLLLLDEPTASLDLHYQIETKALLKRLNAERRLTIVVSTHDLNFAAGLCEALILLRQGEVLAAGPTASVLTREAVRHLYSVDADVRFHEAAGHLTVVPLSGGVTRSSPDWPAAGAVSREF